MGWGSPTWQRGSGKVWVCALSPSGRRWEGGHGNSFSAPCASPQGSHQCMHIGLKNQTRSKAAASCRDPTCHPSSHFFTAGWHCSHSSLTPLQVPVPNMVCCHKRAPPAPFASACATMPTELCSGNHQQEKDNPRGSKFQLPSTDMVGSLV